MEINYEICIAGLSEISKKKFFKFIENIYSLRLATYIPRYDKDKTIYKYLLKITWVI